MCTFSSKEGTWPCCDACEGWVSSDSRVVGARATSGPASCCHVCVPSRPGTWKVVRAPGAPLRPVYRPS